MQQFFSYWFWPNPAGWQYADARVQALMLVCVALVVIGFLLRFWRQRLKNPATRSLSASWPAVTMTFGLIGLVLAASRVEKIQFVSMRALWAAWLLCAIAYIAFQLLNFRNRHYVVLERQRTVDTRDKYLPRKKR